MRPEKYKTNHKKTLLASEEVRHTFLALTLLDSEEVRSTFFVLSWGGSKKVKLPPTQCPSKAGYSLSFTSVKESNITQKDPFDYEKWGLQ